MFFVQYPVFLTWLLGLFGHGVIAGVKQHLDGSDWVLSNEEKGYEKLKAVVPGGVYSVLMENHIIDDVFYGNNDVKTRWVSKTDWNYSTQFSLESDRMMEKKNIDLVFDGVDTFATVVLNGHTLGSTENMFVRYIYDVKPYLKKGENHLEVRLKSAVNEAKRLFLEQSKNYSVVPLCVPDEYNGECHVNHIRKTQASFSWDWGPALPSMGIWKSVFLEAYDSVVIRDVTIKIQNNTNDFWDVEIKVYLDGCNQNSEGTVTARVATDIGQAVFNSSVKCTSKSKDSTILKGSIDKTYVKLWWPNGYGNAHLYSVDVTYTNPSTAETSSKAFRIGFRTVELVQEPIESGLLFYFKVNNIPIFAKGSNSIPINILPELAQDKATIQNLLQSAKDVNMNMLRVWGGGNYEADVFYELADEYGILIWQDFMFACNMYPATEDFLSDLAVLTCRNVRNEVRHQVRRLQHHASIIMWAGNNENEAALRQNWYGTEDNFDVFKADYIKLYIETIQPELFLNDDTRTYLASSPSNGLKSDEEGHVAMYPQSNNYGDIHFYNYNADSWNTSNYPIPRFSSEYGYQALPGASALLSATNTTADLNITSSFLRNRQHLPEGFEKMTTLIDFRLKLPKGDDELFDQAYIFNSQVMQAMSVKIETEFNRHWRSSLNTEGLGHTMGSLYWQLNDVWLAPTWSGIDFKGNWKMMQYFSKDFFAPVIVTGDVTPQGYLDVYIVSDLTYKIFDAKFTINVYNWNSLSPVHNHTVLTDIQPNRSEKILRIQLKRYLSKIASCGESPTTNCFLYFTVTSRSQILIPNNYVFPAPLKIANLSRPKVTINAVKEHYGPNQYFTINISVDAVALFVWLEFNGNISGRFSDNGFLQVTNEKTVTFTPKQHVSLENVLKSLTVTHLRTYV